MKSTTTDKCVDYVLGELRHGRLDITDRLSIDSIAVETGTGHASARAAFERLEMIGVIERRPRSGTYIRKINLAEYVQALEVRAALEGMACRLASVQITQTQLDKLIKQAKVIDEAVLRDLPIDRYARLDAAFHLSIARIGGNCMLMRMLDQAQLVSHFMAAASQLPELALTRYLPHHVGHQEIVHALRKNADEAERCIRQHILQHVQIIKQCRKDMFT
jgi:GntR family transcriptional regulator of vanillate catabolism